MATPAGSLLPASTDGFTFCSIESICGRLERRDRMDQAEAQRLCGQCHRQVAESNFALHEAHCRRFLCVCPDCEESVPREQLEQHRQEQHILVRCSKCHIKVERCYLSDHESDECVERLQRCDFCELDLPWRDLQEHSLACGSRTELCVDCRHYVTLRDRRGHTCPSADQVSELSPPSGKPGPSVTCSRCRASLSSEAQLTHELTCAAAAKTAHETQDKTQVVSDAGEPSGLASLSRSNSYSVREALEAPDQIRSCSNCHLALPVFTLRWHETKCQRLQPRK